MARIRTIKPEFWTDAKTGTLSDFAKCLFLGLLNHCDDHGVVEWSPAQWRAKIFPYHSDTTTGAIDKALIEELLPTGLLIHFWQDDENGTVKTYGFIRNFEKHQVINKPSKPLLKNWKKGDTPETYGNRETGDYPAFGHEWRDLAAEPSDSTPTPLREHSRLERKGRERKGKDSKTTTEKLERESVASEQKRPAPSAPDSLSEISKRVLDKVGVPGATALPETWTPDDSLCEQVKATFGMTDDDLRTEVIAFHAYHAKEGSLSANWRASFVTFCKRWYDYRDNPSPIELQRPRRPEELTEAEWDKIVDFYARTSIWPRNAGPDPMHVGRCKAPLAILRKYNIDPETGEKCRLLSPTEGGQR
jgi:hypothetical protein